ncbi:MAG: hypothetical protein HYR94_19525 [Chloroflexi bacterium]|nr:hypothetical protein [Chloroflexota bacterium]
MNQADVFSKAQFNRLQQRSLVVGLLGLVLCGAGAFLNLEQFWQSYLLAYVFWLEISLGCLAVVMTHHLAGGRWGAVIRRLMETGAMTLPLMALLFVPLLFGLDKLYLWTDSGKVAQSELLQHKSIYLNMSFFLTRTVIYFGVWLGLAYGLNRWSLEQDRTAKPVVAIRLRRLSALGLILYVLTATFAGYDWLMSLEPEWFSSIYGILFIVGQVLAALAFAVIMLAWSNRQASVERVAGSVWANHFNDLGNFILAFVMIWAYISFSQFLIIWSANIPEEAVWYYHRSQGGWQWLGLALILFHFALPFLLLLSRRIKRQAPLLVALAVLIFFIRWVDLFWLIAPAFHPQGLHLHWLDLIAPIAMGGIWLAAFVWQLSGKPLLPRHDPRLQEAFGHE